MNQTRREPKSEGSVGISRERDLFIFCLFFCLISALVISSLLMHLTKTSGFFFLIQYILFLFYLFKIGSGLSSPLFLLSFLLLISHAGYPILFLIGGDTASGFSQMGYTNEKNYWAAFLFVAVFLDMFYLGVFLYDLSSNAKQPLRNSRNFDGEHWLDKEVLQIIGLVIFCVCIGPYLFVRVSRIFLFFKGGYLNTFNIGAHGFIYVLSDMMSISIFCLVLGFQNKKNLVVSFACFFSLFEIINILTGNRGMSVMNLLILFLLLYHLLKLSKKAKIYLGIIFLVAGYLACTLLSTVGTVRNQGFDLQRFANVFLSKFTTGEGVVSIFSEFSVSIASVFLSIGTFPDVEPYSYGLNYLSSFLMIFPNFFGNLSNVMNQNTFIFYFPNPTARGGSIIGESYYAFGPYGLVIGLFFGFVSEFLSHNFMEHLRFSELTASMKYLIPIGAMMWWIRGYFYDGIRLVVWSELLFSSLSFVCFHLLWNKHKQRGIYLEMHI